MIERILPGFFSALDVVLSTLEIPEGDDATR
jgi:hypothetical protein